MENCLVTKLSGVVSNPDLPKFGIQRVLMPQNRLENIGYIGALSCGSTKLVAKIHGTGYLLINDQHVTDVNTSTWNVPFVNDGIEPSIIEWDVYKSGYIVYLQKIEDLIPSDTITAISFTSSFLSTSVDGKTYRASGNVDNIYSVYPNLKLVQIMSPLVTGNIVSAFGNYVNLVDLLLPDSTSITGEIASLASALVTKGRSSGSLLIKSNGVLTLNGTTIANGQNTTIKFGTSMTNPTEQETAQGWQVAQG